MLKKISKLFLGLVVCAGSAYVTPTYASSADIIMTHVQPGGAFGAKDEFVALYNNSSQDVDITGWCLQNKADVSFACFTNAEQPQIYVVPGFSSVTIASHEFVEARPDLPAPTITFTVTNQSSGSLVSSADTARLLTPVGSVVDSYTWGSTMTSGRVAVRTQGPDFALTKLYTSPPQWSAVQVTDFPESEVVITPQPVLEEPPIESEQDDDEAEVSETLLHPIITELLPNPKGSDTGNEFIELYNPNPDTTIELSRYRLHTGTSLTKSVTFPAGAALAPLEYKSFYNSEMNFTLTNTNDAVQLFYNGVAIGEPVAYSSPKDDQVWALVAGEWVYLAEQTPGAQNPDTIPLATVAVAAKAPNELKPCAENQYRSPETNRCRLVATSTSTLKPCAPNQYRSPETNRCRNIASATKTLVPCKPGQERSPETNRCRTVPKMTAASDRLAEIPTTQSEALSWYLWLTLGSVVLLILSYAVWEWRDELRKLLTGLRTRLNIRPPAT